MAHVLVSSASFFVTELSLGQTNVLFGLLLVLALADVQARRAGRAGVLVAVATFVKPYGVLLFPWLAAVGGLTAALTSTVAVLIGLALPATVYGWQGNLALLGDWYRTVTDTTPENLMYGREHLGDDDVGEVARTRSTRVRARRRDRPRARRRGRLGVGEAPRVAAPEYLEFALILLLIPLLSPQGWDYVLLLGTPAIACLHRSLSGALVALADRSWARPCSSSASRSSISWAAP